MRPRLASLAPLVALIAIGVGAPITLTEGAILAGQTAECATCCPQEGSTCLVCGTDSCSSYTGYYEGRIGPNGCDGVRKP